MYWLAIYLLMYMHLMVCDMLPFLSSRKSTLQEALNSTGSQGQKLFSFPNLISLILQRNYISRSIFLSLHLSFLFFFFFNPPFSVSFYHFFFFQSLMFFCSFNFFSFSYLSRASPMAYGSSQARGRIRILTSSLTTAIVKWNLGHISN